MVQLLCSSPCASKWGSDVLSLRSCDESTACFGAEQDLGGQEPSGADSRRQSGTREAVPRPLESSRVPPVKRVPRSWAVAPCFVFRESAGLWTWEGRAGTRTASETRLTRGIHETCKKPQFERVIHRGCSTEVTVRVVRDRLVMRP